MREHIAFTNDYIRFENKPIGFWFRVARVPRKTFGRLYDSMFGWLLWNPVLKVHHRNWGPLAPNGGCVPFLDRKAAPHHVCAMISLFGIGWFSGYVFVGRRYHHRQWWFGRVELQKGED